VKARDCSSICSANPRAWRGVNTGAIAFRERFQVSPSAVRQAVAQDRTQNQLADRRHPVVLGVVDQHMPDQARRMISNTAPTNGIQHQGHLKGWIHPHICSANSAGHVFGDTDDSAVRPASHDLYEVRRQRHR
jgi:hypothetical protein